VLCVGALVVGVLGAGPLAAAQPDAPSRKAAKGCTWTRLEDTKLGFAAWVQRCTFGARKIDFLMVKSSLAIRYSDGGAPEPLVDVLDLLPSETAEAGIQRIFKVHTPPKVAARCVLRPYHAADGTKPPSGVQRFTFVANAAYAKELKAKEDPNEVGDPACGNWGDAPDGIQYFESQPASGARKILFVRVGQDEPLFDDQTLRLLPAH
jgi:hypothetical protein